MNSRVSKPLVSPTVVGRQEYLQALDTAFDVVSQRTGQIVLMTGNAGIGKTRLVREAMARSRQRGFLTLCGRCFEGDETTPYALLTDLFRAHLTMTSRKVFNRRLGIYAQEIVKFMPELRFWMPDAIPSPTLDGQSELRRLFSSINQFFIDLLQDQPLLIVFEDLHWCDETTLEFLLRLARIVPLYPILLIFTYRHEEVHTHLRHFLTSMERERLSIEYRLLPLNVHEVDEMIQSIFKLHRPVNQEFLRRFHRLTGGNPFFVEEMLKSLANNDDEHFSNILANNRPLDHIPIPRTVEETVLRRSKQLTAEEDQVLKLAAAAGQEFGFALLCELLDKTEAEMLTLLKALIAAQLIIEESPERFAFRHALTRQAVYTQMLARERQMLHQRIGEAIEQHPTADMHISELAYHFYHAGDWAKTAIYSLQAGEQAVRLLTPRAAIEHFTHTFEAYRHLAQAPPSTLLQARAAAYDKLGNFEYARLDYEAALQVARERDEWREEWRALLDLGTIWLERDYSRSKDYLDQALAISNSYPDQPGIYALGLTRLAYWHMHGEETKDALHYLDKALRVFEQLENHDDETVEVLTYMGISHVFSGDLIAALSWFRRARLFAEQHERFQDAASAKALMTLCAPVHETNTLVCSDLSLQQAEQRSQEAYELAHKLGLFSREMFADIFQTMCAITSANYEQALHYAARAFSSAEEADDPENQYSMHHQYGVLYTDLFQYERAHHHLVKGLTLAEEANSQYFRRLNAGALALTYVAAGRLDQAQAMLDTVMKADTPKFSPGQRFCWYARAVIAFHRGDVDAALKLVDDLLRETPNLIEGKVVPLLTWLRGDLLNALGRKVEAESELRAARDEAEAQGARAMLWRIEVSLGTMLLEQHRRDDGARVITAARQRINECGATIPDEAMRSHFLESALARLPLTSRSSESPGGLTNREREVAGFVARGYTNRQIAEALVISPQTATVHVKHILAKLKFTSRTQIAAWAIENKLSAS